MQQNQQPATQRPQPPTTRPVSTRLVLVAVGALVFIFLVALLPSCSQIITFVTYTRGSASSSTSTSTNSVVEKANDVLSKADQESAQTQNLLNQITSFATILGLILALFAVVTAGLGLYGFSTNTGFRDLESQWREQLAGLAKLQQETESRGADIGTLQNEMRQKQQEIDRLQTETKLKQQEIDALQQRLEALKEKIEQEVASVEQRFETISTAVTFLILGNQLLEQRQRKQAIEVYERAHKLKPDDPQINFALGRAYSGAGVYEKAITYDVEKTPCLCAPAYWFGDHRFLDPLEALFEKTQEVFR